MSMRRAMPRQPCGFGARARTKSSSATRNWPSVPDRVGHFLQRQGVEPGDRIVLCLPNVAAIWELMLAAIKIGAVIVPTTTLATESEIRDRLVRSGARIVVTDESAMDRIPSDAEVKRILVGGQTPG